MHPTPSTRPNRQTRPSHTTRGVPLTPTTRGVPTTPTTRVLAAASAATVTAATALLLAVVTAAPAAASRVGPGGQADLTGFTPTTGVSEESVVAGLEPAVIGIHQGITGSFAHVPAPTVQTPKAPPAPAPPALPAVRHTPVRQPAK